MDCIRYLPAASPQPRRACPPPHLSCRQVDPRPAPRRLPLPAGPYVSPHGLLLGRRLWPGARRRCRAAAGDQRRPARAQGGAAGAGAAGRGAQLNEGPLGIERERERGRDRLSESGGGGVGLRSGLLTARYDGQSVVTGPLAPWQVHGQPFLPSANALPLWLGNTAYVYISVSLIQMIKVGLRGGEAARRASGPQCGPPPTRPPGRSGFATQPPRATSCTMI
jgi:hypothetical protein